MISNFAETIKKTTQNPGIYIFKTKKGEFLYIGKAGNLKNRLRQYLGKKIIAHKNYVLDRALKNFSAQAYAPFLEHILNEAEKIEIITTDSEIEALILESGLIKEKRPKYNVMLRDDKQYFYVVFTKDKFPKIYITHQPYKNQNANIKMQNDNLKFKNSEYIGPFTDGVALKTTLRLLRRIFPYCTCKQPHHNFCLNYHIGKCLGFCCLRQQNPNSKIKNQNAKLYEKNIKAIKNILSGKKDYLIKKLKKELNSLAKQQNFEKAIELRNKIEKLEKIFENAKIIQDSIYKLDLKSAVSSETLKNIFRLPKMPRRIEGYDISNIQGKNAVGAMIVFTDGKPDKKEYRKFKIIFKKTPDDVAMLKEILIRRFSHPEWPFPDLVFIDGGKGQLNAAKAAISQKIPIISLAKGKNEIFSSILKNPVPINKLPIEARNLILQIDSEAHRFAIGYYRKLHRVSALPKALF